MVSPAISAIDATKALAARRWRVAAVLTAGMVLIYFGFIALVAWRPVLLAQLVQEGLSLGIVLGALVIVAAWALTLIYVSWANRTYDPALAALREQHAAADAVRDAAAAETGRAEFGRSVADSGSA